MIKLMNILELNNLDLKLDKLMREYQKILKENEELKKQLALLKQDKSILSGKNELAVTRIKHIIGQLREEIHERTL
jgi:uncharacterized protein (TIGR02449 family)